MRDLTNKADLDRLFPKNVLRRKTKNSNDLMYTTYSAKEIVRAYIQQSKASWKAIESVVASEMAEGHDYTLEGHQIHPALVAKLVKKYGKDIRPIFLVRTNAEDIVSGCLRHKAKNDWFIHQTTHPATYHKIAEMLILYSRYYIKEAKKVGLEVVNMDGDFGGRLGEIAELS